MVRGLLLAAALVLLAACAGKPKLPPEPATPADQPVPRSEPPAATGNRSPYRVHGRTYRVLPSSGGYRARGVASWYGPKFHGRLTSSGEVFDMYQFTAAHRTLPLPTYARVRNPANDRSVVVRINDRGPFKDDRLIDLSFAAARELGIIDAGTAEVEIEALAGPEGESPPAVLETSGIFVQVGAFGERDNALAMIERLRRNGISGLHLFSSPGDPAIHRVRVGPMATPEEAEALAVQLTLLGFDGPRVIFE